MIAYVLEAFDFSSANLRKVTLGRTDNFIGFCMLGLLVVSNWTFYVKRYYMKPDMKGSARKKFTSLENFKNQVIITVGKIVLL